MKVLARRLGINKLMGIGIVGAIVSLLFCGTMLTPLLVAVFVVVGLGVLAPNVEGVVLAALVAFVGLAAAGWWLRRMRRSGSRPRAAIPSAGPGRAA
ncbi:MAG: hypothetical protein HY332_09750 [Chloroflexi bacterium]|nr:hypothetical protein [Chloroflexota bacterium]